MLRQKWHKSNLQCGIISPMVKKGLFCLHEILFAERLCYMLADVQQPVHEQP